MIPDILSWWTMAFNLTLLAIPAMSTECERIFSVAKHTVGIERYSLEDTTNMLEELAAEWKNFEAGKQGP
jgi:hAT family C-terminal dimerisation region